MYENANPAGYHSVTPAIVVRGAADAIKFYEQVFAAKVRRCTETPEGKIMHAELNLGDASVMLNDEFPDWGSLSPQSLGGSATVLQLYVTDADAVFAAAVAAGAEIVHPMTTQFWGDRMGRVKDPFGHQWSIATRVEEVSDEEIERRGAAWLKHSEC